MGNKLSSKWSALYFHSIDLRQVFVPLLCQVNTLTPINPFGNYNTS